jgi:hypothetical protein
MNTYPHPVPRVPTQEELELIFNLADDNTFDSVDELVEYIGSQNIAVFDKYISDGPGYTGRVAVLIWGAGPNCVSVFTLDGDHNVHYTSNQLKVYKETGRWVVSIMLVDRAYGGPEEGGWWFNYGQVAPEHAKHTKVFNDEKEAENYLGNLRIDVCKKLNEGRRDIGSVLSEGIYEAVMQEGSEPHNWPRVRPHYC